MTQTITSELNTPYRTYDIIQGIVDGLTHTQIAESMHLSRATIERELREIRTNKELQAWIVNDWLRLHGEIKKNNPVECYRALTSLIKSSDNAINLNQTNISQIRVVFGDSLQVVDSAPVNVSETEKER